jgi:hypothetical protein
MTRWCGIGERFPGWPCCSCSDLPFLSRARTCGRTIFDSLAGVEERLSGFRTVDGGRSSDGRGKVRPLGRKARPVHWSARAVCGEAEEFPFEHTTSIGRRESSPHAGSNVRVQYANPIPRSDAHNMVAANGQVTRLLCGDGCRLVAVMADIWLGLDTGQDPRWSMMSSRPAIADRDGPTLLVRRVMLNTGRRRNSQASRDPPRAIRCSRAGSPSPAEHAKPHPNGACARRH